jgi:hypothetical protein
VRLATYIPADRPTYPRTNINHVNHSIPAIPTDLPTRAPANINHVFHRIPATTSHDDNIFDVTTVRVEGPWVLECACELTIVPS